MLALTFTAGDPAPRLDRARPIPTPAPGEALVRVLRCGVCATDLEIVKGYIPGYAGVLCHEFVGVVEAAPGAPAWEGVRVTGEINCPADGPPPPAAPPAVDDDADGAGPAAATAIAALLAPAPDRAAATARNHATPRTVLGIVGRDGCAAEWVVLPLANLHPVPASIPDARAAFVEPLAAACRVVEQGLVGPGDAVAVVGDGRLGLLVAAVLTCSGVPALAGVAVTHLGRHPAKLALVGAGGGGGAQAHATVVVPRDDEAGAAAVWAAHAGRFDAAVEATGTPAGAAAALGLLRPGGTLVLKSTCAPPGAAAASPIAASSSPSSSCPPVWSAFANDVVVQEKAVVGSRCGPFPPAMALLAGDAGVGALVDAMVTAVHDLEDGVAGVAAAGRAGVVKVQLVTAAGREAERRQREKT